MCGRPDMFRADRDLGRVRACCSCQFEVSEGCSSRWLPAWLPPVHDAWPSDALAMANTGPLPGELASTHAYAGGQQPDLSGPRPDRGVRGSSEWGCQVCRIGATAPTGTGGPEQQPWDIDRSRKTAAHRPALLSLDLDRVVCAVRTCPYGLNECAGGARCELVLSRAPRSSGREHVILMM